MNNEKRLRDIEKEAQPHPATNFLLRVEYYGTVVDEDGRRDDVPLEEQEYDENVDWEAIAPTPNGDRFAVLYPKNRTPSGQ